MTNLVRVRKSVLGKSAPSLSAGMVCLYFVFIKPYIEEKQFIKNNLFYFCQ